MPSLEENKAVWGSRYNWENRGDEWSAAWGTVGAQWQSSILPRIQEYLASSPVILEIAPGFGRFSAYLHKHCDHLLLVDISEKCIEACKTRFQACSNIEYFINDGTSLDFIADDSLDFVFSFDSLVHADEATLRQYIFQLSKKLKRNGIGFIHPKPGFHARGRSSQISSQGRSGTLKNILDKPGRKCVPATDTGLFID